MERSSLADIGHGHKFNEFADRQQEAVKKVQSGTAHGFNPVTGEPIVAQAKYEEYYEPQNPNADWSGFVPNPKGRQHQTNPNAYKVSLAADENYNSLVPNDAAQTSDWKPNANKRHGNNNNRSTMNLIGGPVDVREPEQLHSSRWETEAQAAQKRGGE